jgi:RNA polymerase sigma-70 factor (ECF subfamily)
VRFARLATVPALNLDRKRGVYLCVTGRALAMTPTDDGAEPPPAGPSIRVVGADQRSAGPDGAQVSERGRRDAERGQRDAERVRRFRAGDRRVFDELVRDYQRLIVEVAFRQLGNQADAIDISQRTFVTALGRLGELRDGARLRAWLVRIAVNLCHNHRRDRRREVVGEVAEDAAVASPIGANRLVAAERSAALRAAVAALPALQRLVIELRIYDELSVSEVAEVAGTSENSVKVSYHHAVKRLRRLLATDGKGTAR